MTTINPKQLLDSPKLSLYNNTKLSPLLDASKLSSGLNLDGSKFTFTTGIDLLSTTSSKSDGTDKPINISHQILAEPLAAVSGTYSSNSFAGTTTNTADAFLSQASDKSKTVSGLTTDGKKVSDAIDAGIKNATKVLSSALEGVSRSSSKANGGLLISASTELKMGANSIHMGSEGVINMMTPVMSTNTRVMQTHANHVANVSDSITTVSKNRFTELQVDQKITAYTQTISTESNRSYSKQSQIVATETNEIQGKNTNIYADDHLEEASAGSMRLSSRKSGTVQSGDLYITASASTVDAASSNADGMVGGPIEDPDLPKGALKLISNGIGKGTGKVIVNSSGTLTSSAEIAMKAVSGSITNVAKGLMVNAAETAIYSSSKAMGIVSGKALSVGTNRNSLFFYGGMTFLGRMPPMSEPIDLGNIEFGEIVEIPELAPIPMPPSNLESCIADSFKEKRDEELLEIEKEKIEDAHSRGESKAHDIKLNPGLLKGSASRNNPVFSAGGKVDSRTVGKPSSTNTSTNKPGSADSRVESKKSSPTRLPTPKTTSSSSSPTKQTDPNMKAGAGVNANLIGSELIKGGLHIYPTRYESHIPQKAGIATDDIKSHRIDQSYKHLRSIPSAVRGAAKKLGTPQKTTDQVIGNLNDIARGIVPDYILSLTGGPELVEETQRMANYVAAIGYFGGVSDLIDNGENIFSDITGISSPYISMGTQGIKTIEQILDSDLTGLTYYTERFLPRITPLIGLGETILKNPNTTFRDLVEDGLISSISQSLSDFLDPVYASAISSISDLILRSTNGKPLDLDNLISSTASILSGITGSEEINTATQLYTDIRGLIGDINSGDTWSVLNGGSLDSLIGFIAGPSNGGAIRSAIDIAESLYGSIEAISKLPELIGLMGKYDIDFLSQVDIVLNCLDLLSKINDLINKISNFPGFGSGSNNGVQAIEDLPRLIEIYNTIKDTPIEVIDPDDKEIIEEIKDLQITLPLDSCFRIPTVNFLEGSIDVRSVSRTEMIFGLARPELNILRGKLPSPGDLIQAKINTYFRRDDLAELRPYRGEQTYSPTVITFHITDYNYSSNIGIAYVSRNQPVLLLEERNGSIYEYDIDDIGSRLIPIIDDAYLVI